MQSLRSCEGLLINSLQVSSDLVYSDAIRFFHFVLIWLFLLLDPLVIEHLVQHRLDLPNRLARLPQEFRLNENLLMGRVHRVVKLHDSGSEQYRRLELLMHHLHGIVDGWICRRPGTWEDPADPQLVLFSASPGPSPGRGGALADKGRAIFQRVPVVLVSVWCPTYAHPIGVGILPRDSVQLLPVCFVPGIDRLVGLGGLYNLQELLGLPEAELVAILRKGHSQVKRLPVLGVDKGSLRRSLELRLSLQAFLDERLDLWRGNVGHNHVPTADVNVLILGNLLAVSALHALPILQLLLASVIHPVLELAD
mmetsp:Transcript_28883/g.51657  ORF Transcript_28883/g.51657 Transcript_28883/m.51657 type:complete len:309 (-) Transcript_28883:715-1641(-)